MTPAAGNPQPPADEVQWIFAWRKRAPRLVPILFPVALATLGLTVLLALVRVKVASPQFEMERQGSLIYLPATGDGLAWAIRAKEAGPSLSRYEPAAWDGYSALDQSALAATLLPPRRHLPRLQEFPTGKAVPPLTLAATGEPVFPKHPAPPPPTAPPAAYKLVPVLYPLSSTGFGELPVDLPAFPDHLDAAILKADWRFVVFLVRLNPAGGVAESLALNKFAGRGPTQTPEDWAKLQGQLENWLRGVTFDPKVTAKGDWIAIGIRFNNRPIHGADDH